MWRVASFVAVAAVAAVALPGLDGGGDQVAPTRVEGRGVSVSIPDGWHAARETISHLTDPREAFVVATFEPRSAKEGLDSMKPVE
jgi:hypothetical protein